MKKRAIIFSGGGAKSGTFIGVFKLLEKFNLNFDIVGGSSAGALLSALWVAGYTSKEIEEIYLFIGKNPSIVKEVNWKYIIKALTSFNTKSLHSILKGKRFAEFIQEKLADKQMQKFGDFKTHFFCTSVDIDKKEEVIFCSKKDKELEIHLPLLASASFPGIFPPVCINNQCLIDGGCKTNYPILPAIQLGAEEVWVIYLQDSQKEFMGTANNGLFEIIKQSMNSIVHDQAESDIERAEYLIKDSLRLFPIEISSGGLLNFSQGESLIQDGYRQAEEIFIESKIEANI